MLFKMRRSIIYYSIIIHRKSSLKQRDFFSLEKEPSKAQILKETVKEENTPNLCGHLHPISF